MSLADRIARGHRWPRAPVPATARAVLAVDLAALRANWARLNSASGRAECAGVIKADAYGLGLAPIAKALTSEGCKTFFVATVEEGRAALKSLVAAWAVDVPGSWFEKNTESLGGMQPLFTKDLVLDVARRQVGLVQKIVSDLGLEPAKADQVRKSPVIFAPLVKRAE